MLSRRPTRYWWIALVTFAAAPASALSIDWVAIGNAGNAADPVTGVGAVAYDYRIGKFEITNTQYVEFLNAVARDDPNGLFGTPGGFEIARTGSAGSYTYNAVAGRESHPAIAVSFYDAIRFANWLHNGQPTGAQGPSTTENGAYTITAQGIADNSIARNPGARFFVPSVSEWYKAAYYDALTTSYHRFPFADGASFPTCNSPPGIDTHSANCESRVGDRTPVGSYVSSASAYGTFDQGGNVEEWTEGRLTPNERQTPGGSWRDDEFFLESFEGIERATSPQAQINTLGIRIASIPEPGTAVLLAAGVLAFAGWRRRS